MNIELSNFMSLSETNSDLFEVLKNVEKFGKVTICENGKPKYVISKCGNNNNEKLLDIANQILTEHKHAFEVLAND